MELKAAYSLKCVTYNSVISMSKFNSNQELDESQITSMLYYNHVVMSVNVNVFICEYNWMYRSSIDVYNACVDVLVVPSTDVWGCVCVCVCREVCGGVHTVYQFATQG